MNMAYYEEVDPGVFVKKEVSEVKNVNGNVNNADTVL